MIHTHALCIKNCPFGFGDFTVGTIYPIKHFIQGEDKLVRDFLINYDQWHLQDNGGLLMGFRMEGYYKYFEDATALVRERKIDTILL